MQKQYVLAYDLGTSGVKGALVDTSGNLPDASAPMPTPAAAMTGALKFIKHSIPH